MPCRTASRGWRWTPASPSPSGVLTTLTDEQAVERARPVRANKGAEVARAAVEMASLFRSLDERPPA